ncbi:hypothetical protein N7450_005489 [Penicillium hetheringtonii]|uniref:67 kDa myosin-cross-reactive antigen family protein n=1 Tax=Penicillium hetheringtonii TaxID=911720 RepID=A0AAD6DIK8_9EURO|nr:hypothetical protein N7450_005489 [Penicillium hetheringtonii]
MVHETRQIRRAWLLGGGVESLSAALSLINDAEIPGEKIYILNLQPQPENALENSMDASIERSVTARMIESSHFNRIWRLIRKHYKSYDDDMCPEFKEQNKCLSKSTRTAVEAFMAKPANFMGSFDRRLLWQKNRKLTIDVLVNDEKIFEQKRIDEVFDSSFWGSGLWEQASSFGFRPAHSAVEFHRYLCQYLDDMKNDRAQAHSLLEYTLHKPFLEPLRSYLKEEGVHFQSNLTVSDFDFLPGEEPCTICRMQAADAGRQVTIPVETEDIVIVTIGSAASGSSTGTTATPPSMVPAQADILLDNDWSLWYRLARKSSKFGNPSTFCTHMLDSRLVVFAVGLPTAEFNRIYTCAEAVYSEHRNVVSVAKSNWSLKLVFMQQHVPNNKTKNTRVILGYGLTPSTPGSFVQKPLNDCCGDEIMAELLGCLGLPVDQFLPTAITIPRMIPLGLSPLLKRAHDDRPDVIPPNTTNIALVGQYVNVADETALTLQYSVRCAQVAVCRMMGLKNTIPKVEKSFIAARYGNAV